MTCPIVPAYHPVRKFSCKTRSKGDISVAKDTLADIELAINWKLETLRTAIVRYALGGRRRSYPWRARGLGPYWILIAEILLKRTTATAAANAYGTFLHRFPTVQDLDRASEVEVATVLAPIGLQQQRAQSVKALARHLVEHEGGSIPEDLDRLLAIPGVGEYSARAILSFAFGVPVAIVDSNVERVFQRVFLHSLPSRPGLPLYQTVADKLLPTKHQREFNWGILDLAALVCRPGLPRCEECPLTKVCDYYLAELPSTASKAPTHPPVPGPAAQAQSPTSGLRALRKARGLSLVELARQSGVSKLTIIKIEAGRTSPRGTTLRKLAKVLAVPPDALLG